MEAPGADGMPAEQRADVAPPPVHAPAPGEVAAADQPALVEAPQPHVAETAEHFLVTQYAHDAEEPEEAREEAAQEAGDGAGAEAAPPAVMSAEPETEAAQAEANAAPEAQPEPAAELPARAPAAEEPVPAAAPVTCEEAAKSADELAPAAAYEQREVLLRAAPAGSLAQQQAARTSPQRSTRAGSPAAKGLTFSGPPYVPKAKPYVRADFSHSAVKLMKITHDNQLLVQRLTSISRQEPAWAKNLNHTAACNVSSSAVNRRKAATVVAQENHALYQRLVTMRPSKDISRDTLLAEHRRHETYRANCATHKPGRASGSPVRGTQGPDAAATPAAAGAGAH